LIQGELSRFF
nr:Chain A, GlnR C-tail peptide [Paenibacillus polymyxa]7TFA_C Chain C, GlnR C-tail peptide [Paenibacillus polymyxa]7TFA_D Chain D, GlnR C-tail peptide [Paenibacillus polymyxa]7TFA_G Chain G, GlnR C-tail peptide [Paenibacillus polymyxa]7TFA_H Chain H, GlnR C-tail peptide [Paenibacillus polymyxa]7TFA_I Chain I, GlnR C-tail peptide [Paenibacillus polymyxa]7TFA_M Chain M, GlnR C-tail peptide [Paenibacillus polymyxa]7TFA_N Chain N, GlnR C-tail peptide [Paenibacillus polymyxa]7TFA_O Chain O, Gln